MAFLNFVGTQVNLTEKKDKIVEKKFFDFSYVAKIVHQDFKNSILANF